MDAVGLEVGFRLPYWLLLMYERLVLDLNTFGALLEHRRLPSYDRIANLVRDLHAEGWVELVDYKHVLELNRDELIQAQTHDVGSPEQWIEQFRESHRIWSGFLERALQGYAREPNSVESAIRGSFLHAVGNRAGLTKLDLDHLDAEYPPSRVRESILDTISEHLAHVNAHLILAARTGSFLHDWRDFEPYYRKKLSSESVEQHRVDEVHKLGRTSRTLFEVAFPEFAIEESQHLLRLLRHRHLTDLRTMIAHASLLGAEFDEDFAHRVLREVVGRERRIGRNRRVVGYATAAIGFLPLVGNLLQLAGQEVADVLIRRRLTRDLRWFYMLSDIGGQQIGDAR